LILLLECLPLLGSVALGSPGVNGRDLGLQNGVDEAVARKHVLALELRGDDHGLESLTTAAYTKSKYDQH